MFPLKDDNPSSTAPVVTVALIVLNALVFVYQISLQAGGPDGARAAQAFIEEFGLVPCRLTGACRVGPELPLPVVTIFTSMFMHGGLFHIGGNMLYLWIFGNNVEDSMGPVRFIAFYLLGGLAATGLQLVAGPNSTTPNLGASGAIAGVLGGYLVMYPRARVVTLVFIIFLFTIVELPAIFFLGFWFLQQLAFGALLHANTVASGGVAYWAHVGGFAAGLLLIRLFATRRSSAADGPRFPVY